MDSEACNFNPIANTDTGGCIYAETHYDCNGNCLNDTDGDGVCDELETVGCTDEAACNYDANATDEGDCSYAETNLDCNGACINDADGDGVCDEFEVVGCTTWTHATTTMLLPTTVLANTLSPCSTVTETA